MEDSTVTLRSAPGVRHVASFCERGKSFDRRIVKFGTSVMATIPSDVSEFPNACPILTRTDDEEDGEGRRSLYEMETTACSMVSKVRRKKQL